MQFEEAHDEPQHGGAIVPADSTPSLHRPTSNRNRRRRRGSSRSSESSQDYDQSRNEDLDVHTVRTNLLELMDDHFWYLTMPLFAAQMVASLSLVIMLVMVIAYVPLNGIVPVCGFPVYAVAFAIVGLNIVFGTNGGQRMLIYLLKCYRSSVSSNNNNISSSEFVSDNADDSNNNNNERRQGHVYNDSEEWLVNFSVDTFVIVSHVALLVYTSLAPPNCTTPMVWQYTVVISLVTISLIANILQMLDPLLATFTLWLIRRGYLVTTEGGGYAVLADCDIVNTDTYAMSDTKGKSLQSPRKKADGGNGSSTMSCPICLDSLVGENEVRRTKCSHDFHTTCVAGWFKVASTCPLCRRDLSLVRLRPENMVV